MSNDNGNMFLALLTGAAIGVGLGILYAPDKGTETRHKIKQKAIDAKNEVADTISRVTEELSRTAETKKIDFETALEKTISNLSYKADDIIVALENKLEELRKKNAQLQK